MSALPSRLWLVRHGQSAGNVARDEAEAAGLSLIDVAERDVDVPLSPLGQTQAEALGRWFAKEPALPDVVLSSPYVRAKETASLLLGAAGHRAKLVVDERLREKEFGSLNRLTKKGILEKFPDEARRYAAIGKFYYRPPGGESWCDVILRLRSVLDHVELHHGGARVLVVAHQVIVLCFRYLLEQMDESQILGIDRQGDVANCGVTEYEGDGDELRLLRYNFVGPVAQAGAPVTKAPDAGRPR